jgi:hypothetical protein
MQKSKSKHKRRRTQLTTCQEPKMPRFNAALVIRAIFDKPPVSAQTIVHDIGNATIRPLPPPKRANGRAPLTTTRPSLQPHAFLPPNGQN